MLHMRWDPYVDRNLNTVELGLTVASLTLAQCGMVRSPPQTVIVDSGAAKLRMLSKKQAADYVVMADFLYRGRFRR